MSENLKNFLEKIEEIQSKKLKVDVLSQKKKLECDPLSFKQQKTIISTITDGITGPLRFQKILNDIILENTSNDDILISDKSLIVAQLRDHSIGSIIKTKSGDFDKLDQVIQQLSSHKPALNKTIKGVVEVELKVPTLKEESKILLSCIDQLKKDNEKDVGKSLGDIYTYEIVKYVDKITIGDDSISFADISIKDRINVVENLPLSINKEIISFIQDEKKKESDCLKFQHDSDEYVLDMDVTFFDS